MALYRLETGKHYYRNPKGQLGRCMVPGDTIVCEEYELGGALDKFICVDPNSKEDTEVEGKKFTVKRIGRNKYDVYNLIGRKITDVPVSKTDAEGMIGGVLESD